MAIFMGGLCLFDPKKRGRRFLEMHGPMLVISVATRVTPLTQNFIKTISMACCEKIPTRVQNVACPYQDFTPFFDCAIIVTSHILMRFYF